MRWNALIIPTVTKKIARDSFTPNNPFEVVPFFHFTNTWNTGIAFGQFRDNQIIVIVLSIVAIAWMLHYFARNGGRSPLLPVALGLLAGGFVLRAIGGWDPYNVTEDADLGFRLARFGYRSVAFASTTISPGRIALKRGSFIWRRMS